MLKSKRFVILDRDGTIIIERNYISDPDRVEFLPGAVEGLRKMSKLGLGLIIVSNQSGVGRGYFDLSAVEAVNKRLINLLDRESIRLSGIYVCPHHPDDNCDCRKPKPGLVQTAAEELNFNPADSFVIGDYHCDIKLGTGIKAVTILVQTGYGLETAKRKDVQPDFIVKDLCEAAEVIGRIMQL